MFILIHKMKKTKMLENGTLKKRIREIFNIQNNFLKSIFTSENEYSAANIHSNVYSHKATKDAMIEVERNKAAALMEKQRNPCR